MRFRTKAIELEAVKFDGTAVPDFARSLTTDPAAGTPLTVRTSEGERQCGVGDHFVLTDGGQVLVRGGAIFEAIFEPVA